MVAIKKASDHDQFRMNPYASSDCLDDVVSKLRNDQRSRLAFWATAVTTTVLPPFFAIPIAWFINVTYKPNMGTWVIPYFLFVLVLAIPLGISTALFSRWARRFICREPLIPFMTVIAMCVVPYLTIPVLKGATFGFFMQTLLLLFWTNSTPFLMGFTLYLFIRRGHPVDDGQWSAPHYERDS